MIFGQDGKGSWILIKKTASGLYRTSQVPIFEHLGGSGWKARQSTLVFPKRDQGTENRAHRSRSTNWNKLTWFGPNLTTLDKQVDRVESKVASSWALGLAEIKGDFSIKIKLPPNLGCSELSVTRSRRWVFMGINIQEWRIKRIFQRGISVKLHSGSSQNIWKTSLFWMKRRSSFTSG